MLTLRRQVGRIIVHVMASSSFTFRRHERINVHVTTASTFTSRIIDRPVVCSGVYWYSCHRISHTRSLSIDKFHYASSHVSSYVDPCLYYTRLHLVRIQILLYVIFIRTHTVSAHSCFTVTNSPRFVVSMGCVCGVCAKEDETRFDGTRSFDMYFERSLSRS